MFQQSQTKICQKCNQPYLTDTINTKYCTSCRIETTTITKWAKEHPEKRKEVCHKWYITHREQRQQYVEENWDKLGPYFLNYAQEHKNKVKIYNKKYYSKNKEKIRAQDITHKKNVPLDKECAHCHTTENLERHHPDYSKPLEVITLCEKCHAKTRRKPNCSVNI